MSYEFFKVEINEDIAKIVLNRPEKLNAMNWSFWSELPQVVEEIEGNSHVKTVIIKGEGKAFSIGLDVFDFVEKFGMHLMGDTKESREQIMKLILDMQKGMNLIAKSKKIYIAAIHNFCIGGALDLIAACDIRIASKDSIYSLRETKLGIVADMGSLQRLPYIIGQSNTRLMAFTGRDFNSEKAKEMGLISEIYEDKNELFNNAEILAKEISSNPYSAVLGSKEMLNRLYIETIDKGLQDVANWNAAFLDIKAIQNQLMKQLNKK